MAAKATCELLFEHLNDVHVWDEFAFEDGDIMYLINAHEACHRADHKRPVVERREQEAREVMPLS